MRIGGLQPVTLLDYPQKLAAIVFTAGCNMRCPFCYNPKLVLPELINPESLYDEQEVISFLQKRKKYLEGLVVTGGEPLLQEDLPQFLRLMKTAGYDIKLDTNGLLPDILGQLIEDKLVDYIAMDIKGPLKDYVKYCGVSGDNIKKSIEIIRQSGLPHEFRSTLVKGLHEPQDVLEMAEAIKGADLYFLQNYFGDKPLAGSSFRGKSFAAEELEDMRSKVSEIVKVCLIR